MKTIKRLLLDTLTLSEYRAARKNNKAQKLQYLANKEIYDTDGLSYAFVWKDAPEGVKYWSNLAVRGTKPKEKLFARLIKFVIRFIPFLMLVIALTGCQKEKPIEPKVQKVFYEVQCADCLIILESEKWNESNELERSKNQSFNVTGKFKYSFENLTRDSVKFSIFVSAFRPKQQIIARAYTNDGHTADLDGWYGFDYPNDNPLQRNGVLKLK